MGGSGQKKEFKEPGQRIRRPRTWDDNEARARHTAKRLPRIDDDGALVRESPARLSGPARPFVLRRQDVEDELAESDDDDDLEDRPIPEDEEQAEEQAEEEEAAPQKQSPASLSPARFREYLAGLCNQILADPEAAFKPRLPQANAPRTASERSLMDELRSLCEDGDEPLPLHVKSLALTSLATVFRDILPSFKIRELTAAEEAVKVTKEVKRERDNEKRLLQSYEWFMRRLERALSQAPWENSRPHKAGDAGGARREDAAALARIAVTCVCSLLESKRDFNYASDLLRLVTIRVTSPDAFTAEACCEVLGELIREDKTYETTLTLARSMSLLYQKRGTTTPRALSILSKAKLTADQKDVRGQEKSLKHLKIRKDKRKYAGPDVAKMMDDADLTRSDRLNTFSRQLECLREIFTLHLRILSSPAGTQSDGLFSQAMRDGVALLPLVNEEFVQGFVRALSVLLETSALGPEATLVAVTSGLTACAEAKGRIDDAIFTKTLLHKLENNETEMVENFVLRTVQCVQTMFLRKTNRDDRTVAEYCVSLCRAALSAKRTDTALALMATQRRLLGKYPTAKTLVLGMSHAALEGNGPTKAKTHEDDDLHLLCGPPIPVAVATTASKTAAIVRPAWELHFMATKHVAPGLRSFAKTCASGSDPKPNDDTPHDLFAKNVDADDASVALAKLASRGSLNLKSKKKPFKKGVNGAHHRR